MIESVNVQVKAGKLVELYRRCFQDKFGIAPVLDINRVMETTRWLVTNVGYDMVYSLLPKYFNIQDEWVKGQGYSFEWFKDNLNKVIALTGSKGSVGPKIKIMRSMEYHCDSCWQPFQLEVPGDYNFSDNLTRCPSCISENRPLKKVTRAETEAAFGKFNNAIRSI